MTASFSTPVLLDDLTIIKLSGDDAHSFLQGQITQDLNILNANTAALAAYCSPRGRVLSTMVACLEHANNNNSILLVTKADNAMAFAQRLRMFVLRAKVDIQILNRPVLGLYSDSAQQAYSVTRQEGYTLIATPGHEKLEKTRYWAISPELDGASSDQSEAGSSTNSITTLSQAATTNPDLLQEWQAEDIRAGLPWVSAAVTDTFIPQTINFDLINGVSFTKGCYPGQEVVARSHYRGTIKRRAAAGFINIDSAKGLDNMPDLTGADTYNAKSPKNPCGRIINIAQTDHGLYLLMEVQLADLDQADFRLKAADGPVIQVVELPYSIQPSDSKPS